jgi:hypothetical protein
MLIINKGFKMRHVVFLFIYLLIIIPFFLLSLKRDKEERLIRHDFYKYFIATSDFKNSTRWISYMVASDTCSDPLKKKYLADLQILSDSLKTEIYIPNIKVITYHDLDLFDKALKDSLNLKLMFYSERSDIKSKKQNISQLLFFCILIIMQILMIVYNYKTANNTRS